MKNNQPIRNALGLGEVIEFDDGTQLPCVPARLSDLEDAMKHWSECFGKGLGVQACYLPGNEKAKESFEELLYIASGRKIEKEELLKKISIGENGREVVAFIDRFLGFKPRDTASEEQQ